jgi:hypothetical protein
MSKKLSATVALAMLFSGSAIAICPLSLQCNAVPSNVSTPKVSEYCKNCKGSHCNQYINTNGMYLKGGKYIAIPGADYQLWNDSDYTFTITNSSGNKQFCP